MELTLALFLLALVVGAVIYRKRRGRQSGSSVNGQGGSNTTTPQQ